jgi:hypothetical protein
MSEMVIEIGRAIGKKKTILLKTQSNDCGKTFYENCDNILMYKETSTKQKMRIELVTIFVSISENVTED